jgi:hypothetical protein
MFRVVIAILAGALITVALCVMLLPVWQDYPLSLVAKVLLWPITVFMDLAGPGPRIGPPEKNRHEGTPVHIFVFFLGLGFSWVFYSVLAYGFMRLRAKRGAALPSSVV